MMESMGRTHLLIAIALAIVLFLDVSAAAGDYYEVLGVERTADAEQIKRAFRDRAKRLHPDKNRKTSPQQFVELQRAHEVLIDSEKRKIYDYYGKDPDDPEVLRKQAQRDQRQRYRQYEHPFDFMTHNARQRHQIQSVTQTLTAENFDELVTNPRSRPWIIQVWRDFSCLECVSISPAWETASRELAGSVHFGRVNYERQMHILGRMRLRVKSLPAVFLLQGHDVKMLDLARMGSNKSAALINFAKKNLPRGNVASLRDSSVADAWFARDKQKMHVVVFGNWPAFSSLSYAVALREQFSFAISPAGAQNGIARRCGMNMRDQLEGYTVAVFGVDGTLLEKRAGMRSKKALAKFLLRLRGMGVPRVTVDNYGEHCLGAPSPAGGLGFLPSDREGQTVCVLAIRVVNGTQRATEPQSEVALLREVEQQLGAEDKVEASAVKVRLGWAALEADSPLGNVIELAWGSKAGAAAQDDAVLLAAIDWGTGAELGWLCVRQGSGASTADVKKWVRTTVRERGTAGCWEGMVPGFQVGLSPWESMWRTLQRHVNGAPNEEDGEESAEANSASWNMGLGVLFALMAAGQYLFLQLGSGSERARERAGSARRPGSGQSQSQGQRAQRAADRARPSSSGAGSERTAGGGAGAAHAGGARFRPGAAGGSFPSPTERDGREAGGCEGGRKGKPTETQRQPAQGASSGSEGPAREGSVSELEERLLRLSVRDLRDFADKRKLNISGCSEKHEIVTCIMSSMRG